MISSIWIFGAVLVVLTIFIGYVMYQNVVDLATAGKTPYDHRKAEYMSNMSERQYQFMASLKGASMTEVIATLETRIYDLEQRLADIERRNQDDGK